ncbi:hypothetical protein KH5_01240 [Urechidicola sp. KH5]
MKKTFAFCLLLSVMIGFQSCKKEVKNPEKKQATLTNIDLKWTAYKTTDKVGVSGTFKEINTSNLDGANIQEIVDGTEFSIPVSSVFTNLEDRDNKLKQFFFGVMETTSLLSGTIKVTDTNNAVATIKMNNATADLPLKMSITDTEVSLKGIMNLEDWNALGAIESINKACFELHKGSDGVSKTWNDVAIQISYTVEMN